MSKNGLKFKFMFCFILVISLIVPWHLFSSQAGDQYRSVAIKAANWLKKQYIKSKYGLVWLADPKNKMSINPHLYSGTAGVVLFFLEAYQQTKNKEYLILARGGANHLCGVLEWYLQPGLYTGVAGIGFTLHQTYKVTADDKYLKGVLKCVELLKKKSKVVGKGIEWDRYRDIIAGGAGIGLFLIYISNELNKPEILEMAVKTGKRLVELGIPQKTGIRWQGIKDYPKFMPNFSHGTAGIAYFLATLYQVSKNRVFLDAALSGAKYLLSIAKTDSHSCLIHHYEPGGLDRYYLGWCHGPVGTSRLFYRLYRITGDRKWLKWVKRGAQAILISGIPEKQTPGFWNNVGMCCGSAGVARFFLKIHYITKQKKYLEFSRKITSSLIFKAIVEGDGIKWIQAEHRVKPELLIAQTGFMQGAAGIGYWLFVLSAYEKGNKEFIILPDSPY